MKDFWENRSYSDSAENEAEGIENEKDSENIAEEESFIRNWFKELKMDLKKVLVIIIALIFFAGYRVVRREIVPVALDLIFEKLDTTDEFFAEVEKQKQFKEDWRNYREQERAAGGPTYRAEDVFAETLKPDHWRNFLVFTSVPEGFYYKDRTINSRDPGDWTITQMYYEMGAEQDFFFYTQSKDKKYNKENLPEGVKKKEGQLFTEVDGNRNKVYWFYEDLTLYLEGNIPMEELEELANDAVNYDELYYDYSAIEEKAS